MKTRVKFTDNGPHGAYVKGDTGFVDGYVVVYGHERAVVVKDSDTRFVIVPLYDLKYIGDEI